MQSYMQEGINEAFHFLAQQVSTTDTTTDCYITDTTEQYDCCSDKTQTICKVLSYVDFSMAGIIFIAFFVILIKTAWLRTQLLMIAIFLFQFLFFALRGMYNFAIAEPSSSKFLYFTFKSAPVFDLFLSMTALLHYLFYLRDRFRQDTVFSNHKSTYKSKCHISFMVVSFLSILLWFSLVAIGLQKGTLSYVSVMLTSLYGLYFVLFLILFVDLYLTLREGFPAVCNDIQKYFVWMIILIELVVFIRMIFISVVEITYFNKSDDINYTWSSIYLVQAVSEFLAAVLLMIIIFLVYKMEDKTKDFFLEGKVYRKVSLCNLKEGVDHLFSELKLIDDQIMEVQNLQKLHLWSLDQVEICYLEDYLKPHINKFEDQLYQSADNVEEIKETKESLHAKVGIINDKVENIDYHSIPQMNRLMKEVDAMKETIKTSTFDLLVKEKKHLSMLDRHWQSISESLKKEEIQIQHTCNRNYNNLKHNIEPVRDLLLQLDQFYQRISSSPLLNETYMQKIKAQLTRDLQEVDHIQKDIISKYNINIDPNTPQEQRRLNRKCLDSLETLEKIELHELNLLKDCNILFSFDMKAAEIKEFMSNLKLTIDHELEDITKEEGHNDQEHQIQLIDIKLRLDIHDIDTLEEEYHQANDQKKNMDFESIPQFLLQYEELMHKTSKVIDKMLELKNEVSNIQFIRSQLKRKISQYAVLQGAIKEFDFYLNEQVNKEMNQLRSHIDEYPEMGELKVLYDSVSQRIVDDIQSKFNQIKSKTEDVNQLTNDEVDQHWSQVYNFQSTLKEGLRKFYEEVFQHQKQLYLNISKMRLSVDLKIMKQSIAQVSKIRDEYPLIKKSYSDLAKSGEVYLLKEIEITKSDDEQISQYKDLLPLHARITEISNDFARLMKIILNIKHLDSQQMLHQQLFEQLATKINQCQEKIEKFQDLIPEAFAAQVDEDGDKADDDDEEEKGEQEHEGEILEFKRIAVLNDKIMNLQRYSEYSFKELNKISKTMDDAIKSCRLFIEDRVLQFLTNFEVQKFVLPKLQMTKDQEDVRQYQFFNEDLESMKVSLLADLTIMEEQVTSDYQEYRNQCNEVKSMKKQLIESVRGNNQLAEQLSTFLDKVINFDQSQQLVIIKGQNLRAIEERLLELIQGMKNLVRVEHYGNLIKKKVSSIKDKLDKSKEDMIRVMSDKLFIAQIEYKDLLAQPKSNNPEQSKLSKIVELQLLERINILERTLDKVKRGIKLTVPEEIETVWNEINMIPSFNEVISAEQTNSIEEQVKQELLKYEDDMQEFIENYWNQTKQALAV